MADVTSSAPSRPLPVSARVRREFATVGRQSAIMQRLFGGTEAELTARAPRVSGWSVGQQLEHMTKVDRGVIAALRKVLDTPDLPTVPGANFRGRVVLWSGFIPRGVVKATAPYHPDADLLTAARAAAAQAGEVDRRIAALAPRLDEIAAASRTGDRIAHPSLGGLDAYQWLRFLVVHRHHHLKLVRDIRRGAGLAPALPPGS